MPASASLEDLKAAQKEGVSIYALLYALRKWRRIGWKNICKLWLEERTPDQLKGEGDFVIFEWCFLLDPVQTLGTV